MMAADWTVCSDMQLDCTQLQVLFLILREYLNCVMIIYIYCRANLPLPCS